LPFAARSTSRARTLWRVLSALRRMSLMSSGSGSHAALSAAQPFSAAAASSLSIALMRSVASSSPKSLSPAGCFVFELAPFAHSAS